MFIFNKKTYGIVALVLLLYLTVNAVSNIKDQVNTKTTGYSDIALSKNYTNVEGRYSIKYPDNWIYENAGKGSVIFSGKKDTPSYFSTVNIQTLLTKKSGGEYGSVKDVIDDIKKQVLKESPKTTFLNENNYDLTIKNGSQLNGKFLIFIYSYEGHIIEQWQIVIPRNDGQVFYTWAYTAPLSQYNQDLPIAKAMLASWNIE
jgi:hypothetical protein